MVQLHRQEKEQFKKLFKQEAVDHFDDRLKVLEIFLNSEHHVTVGELVSLIEQNGYALSPDFVLETLKLMCRFGFAQKNRFEDGHIRYEHMHLGQHHDHMICTRCDAIVEFQNEELEVLQLKIASEFGFHPLQHKMELYGICARCMKDHARLMPLTLAKQGERVKVTEFTGGSESRMRLLSMGLRIGDEVQVITNLGKGQMAIAVDFKRFVIGRGLAQKIMVLPIHEEKACWQAFMLLSEIKEGQTARILRVGGSGALRRRIFEMGIVKGTQVCVDKYAPLKDPLEIIVMGYHLSLRVEEASQVTVELIQTENR